jgi:kynurenine formamidase
VEIKELSYDERVQSVDVDHFYVDGVLVDLVQIRVQNPHSGATVHEFNKSEGELSYAALLLSEGKRPKLHQIFAALLRLSAIGIKTGFYDKLNNRDIQKNV